MIGQVPQTCSDSSLKQMSMSKQLSEEKISLESRLEEINNAISVLNKSPEIKEVFDTIIKLFPRY